MNEHRDPIRHDDEDGASLLPGGEPGVKDDHPVGTTTGTGAGATIGAVIGTAVAGPAGAVVGGIVGGVVGGGAGHGIADAVGGGDHGVEPDEVREGDRLDTEPSTVVRAGERPLLADDVATSPLDDDRRPGRY